MYQLLHISMIAFVEAGGGKVSGTQSRDMATAVRKKKRETVIKCQSKIT